MNAGARPSLQRAAAAAIAVAFVALHLPFLPSFLDDVDAMDFALGLRGFDVVAHRPHPPGYPLFIALGKIVHLLVASEAGALALVSVAGGALGVFAVVALSRQLDRDRPDAAWPIVAALLTASAPLYWFTAARPLSDTSGLAAAIAVQAMTMATSSAGGLALAAGCAGLAVGLRTQVAWLTLPLLALGVLRARGDRRRALAAAAAAYIAGALIWAIPLVRLTGGPGAYWRALVDQGADDLGGVQMLWTTPTVRHLVASLYFAFVAPWASWPLATAVLVLAAAGLVRMYCDAPSSLLSLAVAFVPYLIFDLLFQETVTTRYALPLVVPIAYLALRGLGTASPPVAWRLGAAVAAWCLVIGVLDVRAYASMNAPAFRLLADMREREAARGGQPAPVWAAHRREALDFRRPLVWLGEQAPFFAVRLPSPPEHEWLELVKYWNLGGRAPVWFVADPLRSDLALFDRAPAMSYRWPLRYPVLLGGARPNEMEWRTLERPGWYFGEGWAITPETGGVAAEDHRGPGLAPIEGWIRRRTEALTIMLGGRNMMTTGPSRIRAAIDGRPIDDAIIAPGFFLRMIDLPAGAAQGVGDYARLTVSADSDRVAVEQFDAQTAGRIVVGYGDGWWEPEYNPATGRLWRWTSARSLLRVRTPRRPLRLALGGDTDSVVHASHITIRVGDRIVAEDDVTGVFSLSVGIPSNLVSDETVIAIETDPTFVPAERSSRSGDRRNLGVRVTACAVTPVS